MNEKAKLTDNIEPDEEAPDGLGGDLNRSSHLSSFEPRNNHMDSQVLQGVEQGGVEQGLEYRARRNIQSANIRSLGGLR